MRALEPARHVVDGAAQRADLVAAPVRHPRVEIPAADAARGGGDQGDRAEHDAAQKQRQRDREAENRQRRDEDLAVARGGELGVEPVEAEAHAHDAADFVILAVAVLALLAVFQGAEERQRASGAGRLVGLLRRHRLHRAREQRIADRFPRLAAQLGEPLEQRRAEHAARVDILDRLEIAEGLDAVAPVDVENADVLQLFFKLLHQAQDDVGMAFEHAVFDALGDGGGQQPRRLAVPGHQRLGGAPDVEDHQAAESQDENGQGQRDDFEAQVVLKRVHERTGFPQASVSHRCMNNCNRGGAGLFSRPEANRGIQTAWSRRRRSPGDRPRHLGIPGRPRADRKSGRAGRAPDRHRRAVRHRGGGRRGDPGHARPGLHRDQGFGQPPAPRRRAQGGGGEPQAARGRDDRPLSGPLARSRRADRRDDGGDGKAGRRRQGAVHRREQFLSQES